MSKSDIHTVNFQDFLSSQANEVAAEKMKAYMKGHFDYYGVKAPVIKQFFNEYWKENKLELTQDFRKVISSLWTRNQRECQYIAVHLLKKVKKQLESKDIEWIEQLILEKSWWDTVDFLASHAVGEIMLHEETLKMKKAEEYINHDNLWIRRTALIFQLFYKEKTDAELLYALIDSTIGSKEFFINKASGWALRQYSKVNPQSVRSYIELQKSNLANLTIKEGSKYL